MAGDCLRVAEDRLVDLPLDRHQLAVDAEEHVAVAAGRIALAQHEGRGVDAVDGSILGHEFRRTHHPGQRRQPVHGGEHLVRDDTGRNLARPADHGRHPHASLERRVHEIAAPRPVRTSPELWDSSAARVVAAEDDDGVVVDARFLDGVQDLTDAVVHLADDVGEQAAALGGLADEIRVGRSPAGASRSSPRRRRRASSPPRCA